MSKDTETDMECLPFTGLLIDLGPQRRKQIERLKNGVGVLANQIHFAIEHSRERFGIDQAAEIIPVLLLYRRGKDDFAVIAPKKALKDRTGD
jgi:hypothetical protein